jgi:ABC-type nitrate/sulfonate/bicarbonate transport system ATPase subunit
VTIEVDGDAMQFIGISHAFDDNLILRNINLNIPNITRRSEGIGNQGQVYGVFGRSGRGKSTLAKIAAGLYEPTEGEVLIGIPANPVKEGEVGMVWQDGRLFSRDTVLGNLVFGGIQNGMSKNDATKTAMDYLKRFCLDGLKDKYPRQLSGGQKRRIAILQSVMCTAREGWFCLVLDEPFTGLDEVSKQDVCDVIIECSRVHELSTLWLISHDISETLAVSDHAALLGLEYDEQGDEIPGSTILQIYDLASQGLAWRGKDIFQDPRFHELVSRVTADISADNPAYRKQCAISSNKT